MLRAVGFTMAEMLIVIAILGILAGVAFVAVQQHQKSVTQLQYDTIAKEIFVAAQNHLTLAKSENYQDTDALTHDRGTPGDAVADQNPEPENLDINTIDDNYSTKWAGNYGEIVWDMGTVNTLGFINLAFQNGNKRAQNFELLISTDGVSYESVFDGKSSGTTASGEAFDLKNSQARYVKFINKKYKKDNIH